VQSPELLYKTGSPEVVLHAILNLLLTTATGGGLHVIVCGAGTAVTVSVTCGAAE
jgi:hypothetical protein